MRFNGLVGWFGVAAGLMWTGTWVVWVEGPLVAVIVTVYEPGWPVQLSVAVPEPLMLVLSRVQGRRDCVVTCRLIVGPEPFWCERVRVVVAEEAAWTVMDAGFVIVESGRLSGRQSMLETR